MAERSVSQTRNPVVPGSSPTLVYRYTYGAPWGVLKTKTPKIPHQMTLNFID